MRQVWIALGSNLGDRPATLARAVDLLAAAGLPSERLSHLYETEPEGGKPEPFYLNAVLQTQSDLEPKAILELLQGIEETLGRKMEDRAGPRTLDLDLLSVGSLVVEDPSSLQLPHPRMHRRSFVLVPLCELDVHWRHPVWGTTAGELLARLPLEPGTVRPYGEVPTSSNGAGLVPAGPPSTMGV